MYNLEHRYQGWVDIPLCEAGKQNLQPVPVWPSWPKQIYVTPLLRGIQTAEILFPGIPQERVEAFKELNFGEFDGYTYEELAQHPAYQPWVDGMCEGTCPGGEDRGAFVRRTVDGFLDLAKRGEETMVIVAHGGTQMALLHALGEAQTNYYATQTKPGWGYELSWDGVHLSILDTIDFTKGA